MIERSAGCSCSLLGSRTAFGLKRDTCSADQFRMDDAHPLKTTDRLSRCDTEALLAGQFLRMSVFLLIVAAGAWMCGSAWWTAQSMGPTRWLGGFLEIMGFFGSLLAIGMVWYALRWRRSTRSLQHHLQDGAFRHQANQPLPGGAGNSSPWSESNPEGTWPIDLPTDGEGWFPA